MTSLTQALASILARRVDEAARKRAALAVVDWLGCAFAGAVEPAGWLLRADAAADGPGPATVIGGAARSEAAAAFANGGLGNILEMDDVHRTAILHPGPVTIPAALAVAEATGAGGAAFLDAVVTGYEAVIRVGRSLGPGHYALWHNTASVGPFGAAAAVARLLGLDEAAMVAALGNAGTQVSGPWQCRHEPVMTKQLHTARAAHAGLKAARLARLGFTGPAFILEGPQGLYAATAPDAAPGRVTADPGGPFLIHETSVKPWPACRHAHAAIDAALLARARIGAAAEGAPGRAHRGGVPEEAASDPALSAGGRTVALVEAVTVRTYGDAVRFCDRPEPATTLEAKFSLQHAVAATLLGGPPPLGVFEPAAIARDDLAALRRRVTAVRDLAYDAAYPARYGTGLDVALADGTHFAVDVPDALGDPENPLSAEGVTAKARTLLAHAGVPDADAAALVDAALGLPDAPDLSRFSAALAAAGRALATCPRAI